MIRFTCYDCGGRGMLAPLDGDGVERECPYCDGVGYVEVEGVDVESVRRALGTIAAQTAWLATHYVGRANDTQRERDARTAIAAIRAALADVERRLR